MPKSKRSKFYAVAIGRKPGVYLSWGECQKQTSGYSNAKFKSFLTRAEADSFIAQHGRRGGDSSLSRSSPVSAMHTAKPRSTTTTTIPAQSSYAISATSYSLTPAILNKTHARHTTVACHPPGNDQTIPFQESSHPTNVLSIVMHFDGGARGNPGLGGAGAEVIASRETSSSSSSTLTQTATESQERKESNDRGAASTNSKNWKRTTRIRQYCGTRTTNNFAEYTGLLCGLKHAKLEVEEFISKSLPLSDKTRSSTDHRWSSVDICIRGDSNLIIQQLEGAYACKSPNIRPLFLKAQGLIEEIKHIANADGASSTSRRGYDNLNREGNNVAVTVSYQHVYRNHNAVADALANEVMDQRRSWTTTFVDAYDDGSVISVDDGAKTKKGNKSSQPEGSGNLVDV